jgi:protein tyrosine/serine phosphatase
LGQQVNPMSVRSRAALSGRFAQIRSNVQAMPARAEVQAPSALDSQSARFDRRILLRTAALTTVGLAIVASAIALWTLVLRDRFVPKRFGAVVPGKVFRSGQISKYLIAEVVEKNGIGTIIDLNNLDPNDADQRAEVEVCESKGLSHFRFPLRGDATGHIDRYAGAVQAIVESEQAGRPVLVHCAAGSQRTGACVSFYRLLVRRDPPESVYRELVRYGWDPKANKVLLDYVNGHMHELAQLLVERHTIDCEPNPLPTLHP